VRRSPPSSPNEMGMLVSDAKVEMRFVLYLSTQSLNEHPLNNLCPPSCATCRLGELIRIVRILRTLGCQWASVFGFVSVRLTSRDSARG
jgi:hypothetical protein